MAKLSSRRPIMLAVMAAFALLLVFLLVNSLAAGAASASVPSVRGLVIRFYYHRPSDEGGHR